MGAFGEKGVDEGDSSGMGAFGEKGVDEGDSSGMGAFGEIGPWGGRVDQMHCHWSEVPTCHRNQRFECS